MTPRGNLADDERATIELFRRAAPSVVYITTLRKVRQGLFSLNVMEIPQGTGSGFIWDTDGHIITNFHVIQEADAAKVTLSDGADYTARLVGVAPDKDLAVLRIDAPAAKLQPILIGSSSDLEVGQKVFAIGNPFGLDHTLTTGIISALGREIKAVNGRTIRDVIQTDAAINPGNSGGPLLDSAGRLVGINTAIYSPSGVSSGIGFAVPVDTINRIVPELISHGRVTRPGLGITMFPDAVVRRIGREGVLVRDVLAGSAAERAGLRPTRQDDYGRILLGDLIVALDGRPIRSGDDLFGALEHRQVGDEVTVTVERDGQRTALKVKLQALD